MEGWFKTTPLILISLYETADAGSNQLTHVQCRDRGAERDLPGITVASCDRA